MKCHGIGRFTKDPELKPVGDTHVCNFTLAMDRYFGKGENRKKETSFFNFVAWDSRAETIVKYCKKGYQLAVDAEAVEEKWVDKETGGNRSKVAFRVTNLELLNNKRVGENSSNTTDVEKSEATAPVENAPF